jgi:hypothetical protein
MAKRMQNLAVPHIDYSVILFLVGRFADPTGDASCFPCRDSAAEHVAGFTSRSKSMRGETPGQVVSQVYNFDAWPTFSFSFSCFSRGHVCSGSSTGVILSRAAW